MKILDRINNSIKFWLFLDKNIIQLLSPIWSKKNKDTLQKIQQSTSPNF